jgi:hypothetical protein
MSAALVQPKEFSNGQIRQWLQRQVPDSRFLACSISAAQHCWAQAEVHSENTLRCSFESATGINKIASRVEDYAASAGWCHVSVSVNYAVFKQVTLIPFVSAGL